MKKTGNRTKVTTVITVFLLAVAFTACGNSDPGTNPAASVAEQKVEEQKAEEQKTAENDTAAADDGEILYGQNDDGTWFFDTTKFDPEKFSQKVYFGGIEVQLPLGTVSDLAEQGVYPGLFATGYGSPEGKTQEEAMEIYTAGTVSGTYSENGSYICILEDGILQDLHEFSQVSVYNPDESSESKRSYKDCIVATFMPGGSNQSQRPEEFAKTLGYTGTMGTLEEVIENLGVPYYYQNASLGGAILYYNYGTYSIKIGFIGSNGSMAVSSVTYLNHDYIMNSDNSSNYQGYTEVINK